jgi:SpoVK/Ycf46/Vps4 family AAA+-type ATPase
MAIRPRFSTFLAAPTGSGKTYIAESAAELLDAKLFVVSAGEWMPEGTRDGAAFTQSNLLATLLTSERVICFIDEIDKFILGEDAGSWSRFCAAEMWATLDRRLPVRSFCKRNQCEESVTLLEQRVKQGLYFIAAGTFQSIFDKQAARTCGFTIGRQDTRNVGELRRMILEDSSVPAELLSRFAEEPIILDYPSLDETAELLERLGLNHLAANAGVSKIEPVSIRWDGVGLRALEGNGLMNRVNEGPPARNSHRLWSNKWEHLNHPDLRYDNTS